MPRRGASSADEILRKAIQIADSDNSIRCIDRTHWQMASQSISGKWYDLHFDGAGIKCTCKYSKERNAICKHARAVEVIMIREADKDTKDAEPTNLSRPEKCCPKCHSTDYKKDGKRPRTKRDPAQRYRCRGCKTRFSDGIGFVGRHNEPSGILLAVMLFAMALSPENIALVLSQQMSIQVHRSTIQRWADCYVASVGLYMNKIPIRVGPKWSGDEKYFKMKGLGRWLYTVMDTSTRFILSWDVSPNKTNYDACNLFKRALVRAGRRPIIFVTDGLQVFRAAVRKAFNRDGEPDIMHFRESHMKNEFSNNNIHERLNGTLAEIFYSARGLQKEDSTLIHAYLIHYNFVRPHAGLGGITPAKAAQINIDGTNIWRVLIENAAHAATFTK